jgi:hypothetical protein
MKGKESWWTNKAVFQERCCYPLYINSPVGKVYVDMKVSNWLYKIIERLIKIFIR